MLHLIFRPRSAAGPDLFLWGSPPGQARPPAVERLAAAGRDATARLVTERLAVETVRGVAVPLLDALGSLAGIEAADLDRLPASVTSWSLAAKLALDLVARERVAPIPRPGPEGLELRWGVSLSMQDDGERFVRLARALPPAAHAVPLDGDGANAAPAPRGRGGARSAPKAPADLSVWAPEALLGEFLDAAADALLRQAASGLPRPPAGTARQWEERFVAALTETDGAPSIPTEGFAERGLPDELAEWVAPARGVAAAREPRLCLRLDLPAERAGSRAAPPWTVRYFLQAPDDPSLLLPAERVWAATGTHVSWMDRSFEAPQETLLRGLAQAARLFLPIERSLEVPRPEWTSLNDVEAWQLLSEAAPFLTAAGITVRLPVELTPSGPRRLRLRLRVGGAGPGTSGILTADHRLNLDALVAFRWEAALGDHALTGDEFKALAALKRPLVQWRGQWLVLDPGEVVEVQRLLARAKDGRIPLRDALAATLRETAPLLEGLPVPVEVVPEGPLASVIEQLRGEPDRATPPADLDGTLRPYQERGLGWLDLRATLGLGGCLADDMGLGKTVQTIALLLTQRAARPADRRPSLVVCPTSVLGNWERELARFAPTLPVLRHHGGERPRSVAAFLAAPPRSVVVTTYSLLRRDHALLGDVEWGTVILDEAQNIKNPAARQAATARALRAAERFALTGTPVENRLADLWSILEFCVPGLLGPLAEFRRRFAIPIERYRDDRAAVELRRLIQPFVLRRLKSDPAVIADLPAKQEMPVVCTLTREQATLYQTAVDEAIAEIAAAAGIERRGRILALLTALKQICNHPAHYLGESGPMPGRSGKLDRLTEMLEETVASGDHVLVYTQYREMGNRLVAHLQRVLGDEVLYLHGGVPRAARDVMVRRFQEDDDAPPVFVLSLKAGGTGLNLTRATRVFHFDRWWNPAVEDQATDRAHRIGQERVVQVYRLLTTGTLEEKIDALLTGKRALADRVIGAGEAWITELSDAELQRLVTLSGDAVVESDEDGDAGAGGAPTAKAGASGRRR